MKRLFRSKKDRMVCGVCGGLGNYFGIDPTLIRLGWILFGLTGAGFFAYLIACFIIPEKR